MRGPDAAVGCICCCRAWRLLCSHAARSPLALPPGPPAALHPHPSSPQVVCVKDGLPTWICELMVSRGNIHEAIEYVKQIEQEIQKDMVIE